MVKNILWDWSGVVKNGLSAVHETINKIFEHCGAQRITLDEFRKEWKQPYMLFYKKYLPNLDQETEARLYRKLLPIVTKKFPVKIYDGMGELLRWCKRENKKSIIVSSDIREHIIAEIEEWGLGRMFEEIYSDIHDKSEGLREKLIKHNCKPEETIFVGDTKHEVEAGKSVGTKTVSVTWGFQLEKDLRKANPDFIVRTPKELEKIIFE